MYVVCSMFQTIFVLSPSEGCNFVVQHFAFVAQLARTIMWINRNEGTEEGESYLPNLDIFMSNSGPFAGAGERPIFFLFKMD